VFASTAAPPPQQQQQQQRIHICHLKHKCYLPHVLAGTPLMCQLKHAAAYLHGDCAHMRRFLGCCLFETVHALHVCMCRQVPLRPEAHLPRVSVVPDSPRRLAGRTCLAVAVHRRRPQGHQHWCGTAQANTTA